MPSKKYDSQFDAFSENEEAKITDGNRLCEKIFQKRANVSNEGKIPDKFWNLPKYKGSYTGQIVAANKLLQKYSMLAISKAIDSKDAKYILSFRNKKLIPIIEKYQKEVDNTIIEKSNESVRKSRRPLGKKNLFSELE
ncbi:hypothetical protein OAQ45_00905 [Candidatus Marinimicrobia bacterium]|jgi:hypothetical protein|nr:hypothetical protein [Candidatus Neomarinimicrobiota bacterium]